MTLAAESIEGYGAPWYPQQQDKYRRIVNNKYSEWGLVTAGGHGGSVRICREFGNFSRQRKKKKKARDKEMEDWWY